ncbi:hypothetical protein HPB52_017620 [Rhipicephalus sanguineus]|uniref:Uncharacterized protein n=1 Tax=Rhipicephalus sanguineus TaxID=34632 RepID=A0A9D4PGJ6_RHISA|nr:hypothetical protein HPB52_017620 [Rhipicephalus sanguineus]
MSDAKGHCNPKDVTAGNDQHTTTGMPVSASSQESSAACTNGETSKTANTSSTESALRSPLPYPGNLRPTPYVVSVSDCSLLHRRPIWFLQPLPATHFCAACNVVPTMAFALPCGDILCECCRDSITATARLQISDREDGAKPRDGVCPLDGVPFVESELVTYTGYADDVQEEVVLCANIEHGCSYRDELRRLEEHLLYDCRYSPKTCNFCKKKNIPECELLLHTLRCPLRPRRARVLRWL